MRILEVSTNFHPGGIQRHVLDLTTYLRSRGHTVVLAGGEGAWGGTGTDPEFVRVPLDAVAGTGGSGLRRLSRLPGCAALLRREIRRRAIDLVHAHETAPALAARLATLGLGVPVVMTFHGSEPSRVASVARIGRLCADRVLSPSRLSLEALIAHGLPADRARQLGLGVAAFPARDPGEIADLRRTLLGGRAGPLIVSLSRLDRQKGLDVMVEAMRRLIVAHPGATCVVAGGGPLEGSVKGWAAEAGVAEAMRFLGPVTGVDRYLRAADIYLLTSRWEALPISIVEAFRAGLPVVATDCGGVSELVDDSVGALVPVGDAAAIAAALDRLAGDAALRQAKGAAALARSGEARFDPDAVHAGFERFYAETLEARR